MKFAALEMATATSTLTCFDRSGFQLAGVLSFDTTTGIAKVRVGEFGFFYPHGDEEAKKQLFRELPRELHGKIRERAPNASKKR